MHTSDVTAVRPHHALPSECYPVSSSFVRYTTVYTKQINLLQQQIADLQRENESLQQKLARTRSQHAETKSELELERNQHAETKLKLGRLQEELQELIKKYQGTGFSEEDLQVATDLSKSAILLEKAQSIKTPPPPLDQPKVKTFDIVASDNNGITEMVLKVDLKTYTREFIWKHEPTEAELSKPGWIEAQLFKINETIALVKDARQLINDYYEGGKAKELTPEQILVAIRNIKHQYEDDYGEGSLGNNSMLQSMTDGTKLRNTETSEKLIEKLQRICFEKEKQLIRSQDYLKEILVKKTEEKRKLAAYQMLEAARRREVEAQLKQDEIDRAKAIAEARDLFWEQMGNVEQMSLASKLGNTSIDKFDRTKYSIQEIAECFKNNINLLTKYLDALESQEEYDLFTRFKQDVQAQIPERIKFLTEKF